jgi:aryl-alcohol dehydrogenase-like predicted oxidoreductase
MPTIGSSDLDVLPLALGANTFGWTADKAASFDILDAFVAGGGSLVDTADVYSAWAPQNHGGESETVLGEWISERAGRDKLVISTKVSQHPEYPGLSAANIAAASAKSLERLQTDRIDLYFAHKDDPETPLEETVAAFAELVATGVVRYVALSNYSAGRTTEWLGIAARLGVDAPVALQPHYNLMVREEFESELQPIALEHNLGVMPYFSLASGFLTGKYHSADDAKDVPRGQFLTHYLTDSGFEVASAVREIAADRGVEPAAVAIAWLGEQPSIVAPIASASKLSHLQPLLDGATLELSAEETSRLNDVSSAFQPA